MTRQPPTAVREITVCKTEKCGWVTPDPSGYCARCRATRPEPKDVPLPRPKPADKV